MKGLRHRKGSDRLPKAPLLPLCWTGWDELGGWASRSVSGAWVQLMVALDRQEGWVPGTGLVQKNSLPWSIPGKCSALLLHVCGQNHASEPLGTSSAASFQKALGYPPSPPAWPVLHACLGMEMWGMTCEPLLLGRCWISGVFRLAGLGLFKTLKPLPTLKNPVVSHQNGTSQLALQ